MLKVILAGPKIYKYIVYHDFLYFERPGTQGQNEPMFQTGASNPLKQTVAQPLKKNSRIFQLSEFVVPKNGKTTSDKDILEDYLGNNNGSNIICV